MDSHQILFHSLNASFYSKFGNRVTVWESKLELFLNAFHGHPYQLIFFHLVFLCCLENIRMIGNIDDCVNICVCNSEGVQWRQFVLLMLSSGNILSHSLIKMEKYKFYFCIFKDNHNGAIYIKFQLEHFLAFFGKKSELMAIIIWIKIVHIIRKLNSIQFSQSTIIQFSSVAQLCPTLCNSTDPYYSLTIPWPNM